jgi:hypothetical protein
MKKETFWQFITRDTGFGKTGWGAFALIMTCVIMLLGIGIGTWDDGGWVAVLFAAAIVAVLMWGTVRNWQGKHT